MAGVVPCKAVVSEGSWGFPCHSCCHWRNIPPSYQLPNRGAGFGGGYFLLFFFTSINRTLPKFNSSPLKNKAWKTLFVLGKTVTFQGRTVKLRGCSSSFVSRIQPIDDTIPVPPFHLPLHFRDRIRPRIFLPRPGGHAWTEMAPVVGTMWCLVSS